MLAGSVNALSDEIRDEANGSIPIDTLEARAPGGQLLTGQGVTIGIVSDTFNALGGLEADIENGDINEGVNIISDDEDGTDEGRAIAQVITDIAPNADLEFASLTAEQERIRTTRFFSEDSVLRSLVDQETGTLRDPESRIIPSGRAVDANSNILYTDAAKAAAYRRILDEGSSDIIVDDISPIFAPIYQPSLSAIAQQEAIDRGIGVFEAAGNRSQSVEVEFDGEVGDIVDFDPNTPGIQGIPVTYNVGDTISAILHWDDPFKSLSPNGEVTADFDFEFVSTDSVLSNEAPVLEPVNLNAPSFSLGETSGSRRVQLATEGSQLGLRGTPSLFGRVLSEGENTGIDPIEPVALTVAAPSDNPEAETVEGQWIARLARGDGSDRLLRASFFDGHGELDLPSRRALNTTSPDSITVGAVDALSNQVSGFSNGGRNRLLFDSEGNRLEESQQDEVVVDILAPTGFNNTFFGQDDPRDADSFPNFFGTSTAAPAAAAVGALLLESDPSLSPAELKVFLEDTADGRTESAEGRDDFGNLPAPRDVEPNAVDFSGNGLINAQAAIDLLGPVSDEQTEENSLAESEGIETSERARRDRFEQPERSRRDRRERRA